MLYNSFPFLIGFLPITLAVFFLLGRFGQRRGAITFLAVASLFFYAWWLPQYLPVLVSEVCTNFFLGRAIQEQKTRAAARRVLIAALAYNIAFLGYFKYTGFLLGTFGQLTGYDLVFVTIVLPLGISFHTFQQIAYLVDSYRGNVPRYRFVEYVLFVTFFPQLIAGPIVHHDEVMPQIDAPGLTRFRLPNVALGISIFAIGLFKKSVIADQLAGIATPIFTLAQSGQDLTAETAWLGALAYTLQLYFDFSGYSDMALGLARMFNIALPANFDSPYKAASIAEFWRRWHMTLSRFLRDYLYIPLGGNRQGPSRAAVNVMITMLLGGLWHGAGWTFVVWGGLHGLTIVLHRAIRATGLFERAVPMVWLRRVIGQVITLFLVIVAWVFFRSADFSTAATMLDGMFRGGTVAAALELSGRDAWVLVAVAAAVALWAPNTIDLFAGQAPVLETDRPNPRRLLPLIDRLRWRPTPAWGLATGIILSLGAAAILGWQSEFLYFQF